MSDQGSSSRGSGVSPGSPSPRGAGVSPGGVGTRRARVGYVALAVLVVGLLATWITLIAVHGARAAARERASSSWDSLRGGGYTVSWSPDSKRIALTTWLPGREGAFLAVVEAPRGP